MVSLYGYITIANLELYAAQDYSALAPAYTDSQVDAIISHAERLINAYTMTVYTSPITDAVFLATCELAYRIMYNRMIDDGAIVVESRSQMSSQQFEGRNIKRGEKYTIGITDDIKMILDPYLATSTSSFSRIKMFREADYLYGHL
jgi:hypothetical protein